MFVPFITRSSRLERRKGGGGGGKSSGSSGTGTKPASSNSGSGSTTSSGKKSSGTSSTSGSKEKSTSVPVTTSKGKSSASAYGWGGGSVIVIPQGQPFAGRWAGGGIRSQIYGTRTYGSGYPGIMGRGVAGRGFPFWYWPVVWGGNGTLAGSYLRPSEYGDSYNTSRVGGPIAEATFTSNSTNTTFHVLSDNSTISSLISSIDANCSSLSSSSSTSPQLYNASEPGAPRPEQAIQYYRASSIVLTLDGYNNSATLGGDPNATDTPLPSGIDMTLLVCLNQTIGLAAPLVNGAGIRWSTVPPGGSLFGLVWLVWWILSLR